MEQPLTWLQTGYHVLAMLASFVGMMFFLGLYFGMPTRLKPPPRERIGSQTWNQGLMFMSWAVTTLRKTRSFCSIW